MAWHCAKPNSCTMYITLMPVQNLVLCLVVFKACIPKLVFVFCAVI